MTSKRVLGVFAALALTLAACGSDDDDTDTGTDTDTETTETTEAGGDDSSDGDDDSADDGSADDSDDSADDGDDSSDDGDDSADDSDDSADDDSADDSDDSSDDGDAAGAALGLSIVSIDFDAGEVVVANDGDAAVELDGLWLCNFPSYAQIAGAGSVEPGATATVSLPIDVSAAAGELGLYTSDSFSSADAIEAYVEWGSADHERAPVAIEAGIWDGNPLTPEGNVLTVG